MSETRMREPADRPGGTRSSGPSRTFWLLLSGGALAVAVQVVLAVLRGASLVSSGAATVFELLVWTGLALAAAFFFAFAFAGRGRHRESARLAKMFPRAVVVSTSVNEERRAALETVGSFSRRVRFPVEMRVVMSPTSMTFWRGDLSAPVVDVRAAAISYEVGEYVTIAGRFRTLRARVPHDGGTVDIPLFPLLTRKLFPRMLPREELERLVERIDAARPRERNDDT